jgi:hypothetical protein
VPFLCKKVAAGAVFRTSHRSPRCLPSPLYSRLCEEALADLSTRGHRRLGGGSVIIWSGIEPLILLVLSSVGGGFMMFFYSALLILLNRRVLPDPIKIRSWRAWS